GEMAIRITTRRNMLSNIGNMAKPPIDPLNMRKHIGNMWKSESVSTLNITKNAIANTASTSSNAITAIATTMHGTMASVSTIAANTSTFRHTAPITTRIAADTYTAKTMHGYSHRRCLRFWPA